MIFCRNDRGQFVSLSRERFALCYRYGHGRHVRRTWHTGMTWDEVCRKAELIMRSAEHYFDIEVRRTYDDADWTFHVPAFCDWFGEPDLVS